MLLRQYAIEWWFVIPSLLTNVSVLPGEMWTPEIVFSVTAASWVFAETTTSSDRNEILHSGRSSGASSKVQISSKSIKRFRFALVVFLGCFKFSCHYQCSWMCGKTCLQNDVSSVERYVKFYFLTQVFLVLHKLGQPLQMSSSGNLWWFRCDHQNVKMTHTVQQFYTHKYNIMHERIHNCCSNTDLIHVEG